jgi:CBS domain-containing protein
MKTIDAVRRNGLEVEPGQTLRDAATLMEKAGVGALAVVDDGRLVGIVTDRDLVCRALAQGTALDSRIDSIMSTPVVTIDADAELRDALAIFRSHDLRRLAVVRGDEFAGVISVDDLLVNLAADLADLARPVAGEVLFGHRDSPVPAITGT